MGRNITYNQAYLSDKSIPQNEKFTTSIRLPKSTFQKLDSIQALSGSNRSGIVELAIEHYYNYLTSAKYSEDLKKRVEAR